MIPTKPHGMIARPTSSLRSLSALAEQGLIADPHESGLAAVAARYAIAITPDMTALIDPNDPSDPIARQFVPTAAEIETTPNERADPIGDARFEVSPGLVHRYPDRVLLKLTHACPVYCRFCFRREMVGPGGETMLTGDTLDRALAYIAARPQIFEVILTGGDPLMLSPRRIAEVTARLAALPHVQVWRWHTRVPVVDPDRVTSELVAALSAPSKAVYIGLHANHAREFSLAAEIAIARLIDAGLPMISQTVLLNGINNDVAVLEALMRRFLALRIKPYYLHHADLAPGTAHFRTSIAEGQALMRALRQRLSGLAMPTYILDIPGGVAKVPVGPAYLADDLNSVTAPDSTTHPIGEHR